ncbi:MAG: DUF4388 domain-containing protein [Pyrinomonadaceae bacterium]
MKTEIDENDITVLEDSIETILIDVDLYVRYKSPDKAFKILRNAIETYPHSIILREKYSQIAKTNGNLDIAAEQCLALASLYIRNTSFDLAHERLQEAKTLDPRISISSGIEAIRLARLKQNEKPTQSFRETNEENNDVFRGDISLINIFAVVEVIEHARLTGLLVLRAPEWMASVATNQGKLVDVQAEGLSNMDAFEKIIQMNAGEFAFYLSEEEFPATMEVDSNKNFLLNCLAALEAEKAEKLGLRDLRDEEL